MLPFKEIGIYFDSNKKLVGVPCGKYPVAGGEYNIASLDTYLVLEPGYSDDELEQFIINLFNACYSKEYVPNQPTAIQKYTGAKGYVSAVRNYRYISIGWSETEDFAYTFRPMMIDKKHKGAFVDIKGISLNVWRYSNYIPIEKGALAMAFKYALEIANNHANW
ncbi:MAG: hypothetical protein FWC32_01275 [Firmicutes bacterium]|nr:hypothetical protein [Bacillota bacterium]